jgi:uncharacterized membrane-anchored protein YhcB (DUF1043 family)
MTSAQRLHKHCANIAQTLRKTAQTLRKHCANIAQTLRKHCANIAQTLRKHCANIAQTLRKHYANTAQTMRKHCANIAQTAQTLRKPCAKTAQTLRKRVCKHCANIKILRKQTLLRKLVHRCINPEVYCWNRLISVAMESSKGSGTSSNHRWLAAKLDEEDLDANSARA